MTRKHFVLLANAIRENIHDSTQRNLIAEALLPALKASNPNFDPYRFMSAVMDSADSRL